MTTGCMLFLYFIMSYNTLRGWPPERLAPGGAGSRWRGWPPPDGLAPAEELAPGGGLASEGVAPREVGTWSPGEVGTRGIGSLVSGPGLRTLEYPSSTLPGPRPWSVNLEFQNKLVKHSKISFEVPNCLLKIVPRPK